MTREDRATLQQAVDHWRDVIHTITHDVLPLAGEGVRDVRARATMQVQIADRVIARLLVGPAIRDLRGKADG